MEAVLQWGLDFIRAVQVIASPPLTVVIKIITNLGGSAVYFILLPLMFWCIDEKKGFRLGIMVLLSVWINMSLKYLLDQPRPFFPGYDPSLGMMAENFGGLPSGHAQNSLVIYFLLASFINKKWSYICAGILCLLIGFSRIYLGVHFPTDVLAGWLIGGIMLSVYFLLGRKIESLIQKGSEYITQKRNSASNDRKTGGSIYLKMIVCALVSFFMILYQPDSNVLMLSGVFFGFCAGYILNVRCIGFRSRDVLIKPGVYLFFTLFLRIVIGTAGVGLIVFLTNLIIPEESANLKLYQFLQAGLGGLWISFAAPWIFVRFNLAPARLESDVPEK